MQETKMTSAVASFETMAKIRNASQSIWANYSNVVAFSEKLQTCKIYFFHECS